LREILKKKLKKKKIKEINKMSAFIIFYLLLKTSFATAEDSALGIRDVLKIALEHNPKILAAKEKLSQYEAQKNLNKSYLYPNLTWILGGNYQKDAVYTGSPKFNGDSYNIYSSDLKFNQLLYGKGVISSIILSDYDRKIQETNIEIEERTLTQNVIESFYRYLLNQQSILNLKKYQDIIQKSLATSTKRYQMGRGQLLDILQVKTQLALLDPQIEQAKNQVLIASQQLINYMGNTEEMEFKLKGSVRTLLLKDIQKVINLKKFKLPEYELNYLQLNQLDYAKDIALAKDYPTVKLVGDYLYNNYKKAELFSDYSHAWAIQVQVSIPIFSGFSSSDQSAIIATQKKQLIFARKDLEDSLSLKQISSLRNLETAEASLMSSESAVKLSEEALAEASRIYKLSQIDFLQFLAVQQSALQAKSSLDQLKFQTIIAYTNYFVATGQPLSVLLDLLTASDIR